MSSTWALATESSTGTENLGASDHATGPAGSSIVGGSGAVVGTNVVDVVESVVVGTVVLVAASGTVLEVVLEVVLEGSGVDVVGLVVVVGVVGGVEDEEVPSCAPDASGHSTPRSAVNTTTVTTRAWMVVRVVAVTGIPGEVM
ncbi:MAG: hypothetical protein FJW94_07625 [Actinobacteria bacterium]|nr:hypothetical protein [Actinomycetota bacterium]